MFTVEDTPSLSCLKILSCQCIYPLFLPQFWKSFLTSVFSYIAVPWGLEPIQNVHLSCSFWFQGKAGSCMVQIQWMKRMTTFHNVFRDLSFRWVAAGNSTHCPFYHTSERPSWARSSWAASKSGKQAWISVFEVSGNISRGTNSTMSFVIINF